MGFDKEQYASKEEMWFSYYVRELQEAGYLKNAIYQPPSLDLAPKTCVEALETNKRGNKDKTIVLAKEHVYTADWLLGWTDLAEGIFCWREGGVYNRGFYPYRKGSHDNFIPFLAQDFSLDNMDFKRSSIIDVKGSFVGRNNTSGVTFPLNQKWAAVQHDIFVQKIVVSLDEKGIFAKTFTPRQVIIDEVYKKDYARNGKLIAHAGDSKLKYEPIILEQFINLRSK